MLHEKPNESFYWKNKLEDLDRLPGEQMPDKTQTWYKLHDRLREKSRNKMTFWYWTAAACLILILGIQWLMIDRKDSNLVNNNGQPKPENPSIKRTLLIDSNVVSPLQNQTEKEIIIVTKVMRKNTNLPNNGASMPPGFVRLRTRVSNISRGSNNMTNVMHKNPDLQIYKTAPISHSDSIQKEVSHNSVQSEYNTSIDPDTIAMIATMPVKKKLRVVHINELDKPIEERIQYARNNASPVFRMNPLNQNVLTSFAVSSNASVNIIRIKLSPTN